jgi:hypothetical protein
MDESATRSQGGSGRHSLLILIKLLHTVIWAFLAGVIVALPVMGLRRQFGWALGLTGVVLVECGALLVNGGKCPLTTLAARFTESRADNFDIYLPLWLARYNKTIFGSLFVAGELFVLGCWLSK